MVVYSCSVVMMMIKSKNHNNKDCSLWGLWLSIWTSQSSEKKLTERQRIIYTYLRIAHELQQGQAGFLVFCPSLHHGGVILWITTKRKTNEIREPTNRRNRSLWMGCNPIADISFKSFQCTHPKALMTRYLRHNRQWLFWSLPFEAPFVARGSWGSALWIFFFVVVHQESTSKFRLARSKVKNCPRLRWKKRMSE